ncbi:hypothetical protein QBC46DRAFT_311464 [Diplogelasinospora grovesii]|uniref:SSCRP protein n=1 Tax=Diplogelasinospora grovesii TaxID=303347 RepID=A0AAN6S5N6_9PEZI|nr:hypothetical protein QBC46DRAFT_311464 [Diplogelasinospora grovesii]
MQTFSLIALASLLASFAAASPAPSPAPDADVPRIVKRGEGVHLVNCGSSYSAVVYCENDGNCNFFPGAGNQCIPGNGGLFAWEGGSKSCKFPGTGTTFTWNIVGNAQSQANFANVGSGNNGFHGFQIFKDDKHVMYTDGNGNQCRSIYYCLP